MMNGQSWLAFVVMLFLGFATQAEDKIECWTVEDFSQAKHRLPFEPGFRATVLVFLQTDCPISNQYAPVLNRLDQDYSARSVRFFRVYSDAKASRKDIRRHTQDYRYRMPALMDPQQALAHKTSASVTPEAVVFDENGHQVYRGRIDNRYVEFGKKRPHATQHDLQKAIESVLHGEKPDPSETKAIGCYIYHAESP